MDLKGTLKRYTDWARPRMRPAFIIIGTQKAGTSALFNILKAHHRIVAPSQKEIHFFDEETSYEKGMRHYLSHFPVKPLRRTDHITFEATPSYIYFADKVAPRIQQHLPGTACVAILRDPVKRAYSAWNMLRDFKGDRKFAHLHDPRSFEQAVADEIAGRTKDPKFKYLARGHYAEQITRFKECIPQELLHIYSYLDLKRDAFGFTSKLCNDLGLSPLRSDEPALRSRVNTRSYPTPLDKVLAKELYQYFAPEMDKLREILGYEIDIMEDRDQLI